MRENGTLESGGDGGSIITTNAEPLTASGGNGGNLGSSGGNGTGDGTRVNGGSAGAAIELNGFTLTSANLGDIRGSNS